MYKIYLKKDISSELLLKEILKEYNLDEEILLNSYGKPYIKSNKIYFNISKSKPYTVCVISDKNIGIDFEKITLKPRVIKKVCTKEEQKQIKTATDFTIMWTKKESYVKYLGMGLSYGLINVDTTQIKKYKILKIKDYYLTIYQGE